MSDVFSKAILAAGSTYHSPDGEVVVTPERLRHWEKQLEKLQGVGYAVPSHFDHANEIELLSPIPNDELAIGKSRSAKATVGKLRSFKVAEDGQSAEILLETLTPSAKEAVSSNAIYVSPVIFPAWKDGAGNEYEDIITSFDLVDHPVDYSQSPFVPAIRMGLNSKPFVLRGLKMSLTSAAKKRAPVQRKTRMNAILQRMGLNPDKKPPMAEDEGSASDDAEDKAEESSPESQSDAPPTDQTGDGDYDTVDQVLDLLQEFGVALPEDTHDGNLIQHLRVALTALLRSGGDDKGDGTDPNAMDPTAAAAQPAPATPMIATMSLQGPAKAAVEYAEKLYRSTVSSRIQETLKSGRCTPAEADALTRQMGAVRLSLDATGTPAKGDVEKWLDSRAAVPPGTFWTDQQRTEAAQKLSVVEPKTEWAHNKPTISETERRDAVQRLM